MTIEQQKQKLEQIFSMARAMQMQKGGSSEEYYYKDFANCKELNPNFEFGNLAAAEYAFNQARVWIINHSRYFYATFEEMYADAISDGRNAVYEVFGEYEENKELDSRNNQAEPKQNTENEGYAQIKKELEFAFDAGRKYPLKSLMVLDGVTANVIVLQHAYQSAKLKKDGEYIYPAFSDWYYKANKSIWCDDINQHPILIRDESIADEYMLRDAFDKKDESYKDKWSEMYHGQLAIAANDTSFPNFAGFYYWFKQYYIPYIQFAEMAEKAANQFNPLYAQNSIKVDAPKEFTGGVDFGSGKDVGVESVVKCQNDEMNYCESEIVPAADFLNGQYDQIANNCRNIFRAKTSDYGASWACMRISSLTDQLLIKAIRIRNIQQAQSQAITDSIESEFIGIVNYSLMVLMKIADVSIDDITAGRLLNQSDIDFLAQSYNIRLSECRTLAIAKNTDYGDIWRKLRIESITDLILSKIYRLRQIQANNGKVTVSENPKAIFQDIVNYAIFALILMQ